jgi:alpha/beta superfamily hydrolase
MRPLQIPVPSAPDSLDPPVLLEGVLHEPARALRGSALVCHPHPAFGGTMEIPLVVALAEALSGEGYRTLRFNFRGVGGSTGRPTGGEAESEDVRAGLAWLAADGAPPAHVVGYSFGAAVSLLAAAAGAPVASLTLIGLPTVILETDDAYLAAIAAFTARPAAPILCLAGEQDQFCQEPFLRKHLTGPSSRIELLPGLGHFFDEQAQAGLCARTLEFLRSI